MRKLVSLGVEEVENLYFIAKISWCGTRFRLASNVITTPIKDRNIGELGPIKLRIRLYNTHNSPFKVTIGHWIYETWTWEALSELVSFRNH